MVLGKWGNTDLDECGRIVNRALDAGITLIDTADMYGDGENESLVGELLGTRRDEVMLCTKFHHPVGGHSDVNRQGNSRRWIMQAVEDSLRRLGTDRIDLYQAHRPDPDVPIEETVGALTELVESGKILAWGTSTFPAEDLVAAHWAAERASAVGPSYEQAPYSILCRGVERAVFPTTQQLGMGVLTWSPLSGGWLTGKYSRSSPVPDGSRASTNPEHFDSDNESKFDAVEALAEIAEHAGMSLTHMALAWNSEHPAVSTTLLGPRTEDQLADLLGAADLRLDEDTLDAIDAVVAPGESINPADSAWTPPGLEDSRRRRPR
ncbi:MAG: aldo/keto reductase [Actinobacteria bacterium]|nr:MAG: aldo/keto reductase [Actinomycetota bacterium]